jgi:proprotein convertase subtilisin/kexin type 5
MLAVVRLVTRRETCNDSSETQCITCRPGRYALSGTCSNICPDGYFADKKRRECLKCPVGCATCNSAVCLACTEGWALNKKGRCVPEGSAHCDSCESLPDDCTFVLKYVADIIK